MNLVKRNTANRAFPTVMDELFKDLLGGTQYTHKAVPPVNIRETEQSFTVELMAAGMKKEDFNIEVDNDLLTISAEVKAENTDENGKFTRREFSFTSFKRSFTLPETVKEDDINAAYQDGILKLVLPKKEEALPKAKRSIEIS
ncbi:Hsp20/alpha crystallin family protein [Flavobacterium sp.]|uniref:Hsp20/alpha crystallin family protein n=1 Tax=Flavobacterium sp. TaxID=239 RepID=UPI004033924B